MPRLRYPQGVGLFRRLLAQRRLAALICAACLCLKLIVPAGYMIDGEHGRLTIIVCSGVAGQPMTTAMTMAMPGTHGEMPGHGGKDHGKPDMPCAFSGLSAQALGAVDPILLAAFIAFILAIGRCLVAPPAPQRPAYLRPPLRGPPARL